MNYNPVRFALYLAVIAAAALLRDPVMIALQAGLGGVMLGVRLEQWLSAPDKRTHTPPGTT